MNIDAKSCVAWLGSFPNKVRARCVAPDCSSRASVWVAFLVLGHGVHTLQLCDVHCEETERWVNARARGVNQQDFGTRFFQVRGTLPERVAAQRHQGAM